MRTRNFSPVITPMQLSFSVLLAKKKIDTTKIVTDMHFLTRSLASQTHTTPHTIIVQKCLCSFRPPKQTKCGNIHVIQEKEVTGNIPLYQTQKCQSHFSHTHTLSLYVLICLPFLFLLSSSLPSLSLFFSLSRLPLLLLVVFLLLQCW